MNTFPFSRDYLDALTTGLTALAANWWREFFGPGADSLVLGPMTRTDLATTGSLLLLVLLVNLLAVAFVRRKTTPAEPAGTPVESKEIHRQVIFALGRPLYLLIWIFGLYLAATPALLKFKPEEGVQVIHDLFSRLFDLGVFAVLFWLFFRFTHVLEARLAAWAARTESKFDDLLVPLLGQSLRVIVPVVGVIFALPILNLPGEYAGVLARGSSILLIAASTVILFRAVSLGEKIVLTRYDITAPDNLQARKVYTQVHVIGKVLYAIILLFSAASVLMLFEEVRRFGTSLLASAGVVGVILGFAAQKTIANLFAGFQLALTQPIRLDDVVIVEGEWGRIEEITLTYVVIRIWDERRLVAPLSYFIEKPFQNWTRTSAELLGSVFVWVDYALPLDETRQALKEIIEASPLWDQRFWNLQVTDATEKTMQIRVLATAKDSSKAWDLRCDIREKLIAFIQKKHPRCLPQVRATLEPNPPA